MDKKDNKYYVYDQKGTKFITARGILHKHGIDDTSGLNKTDGFDVVRSIMDQIAQKFVETEYPVMSNKDYERASFEGRLYAANHKDNNVDKWIQKYVHEQTEQREWVDTEEIMDIKNLDEKESNKIQSDLKKELHRMPTHKEAYDKIMALLTVKANEAQDNAPKVFFPQTKERGIRYDIFMHEFGLNDCKLLRLIPVKSKNGKTKKYKIEKLYKYKENDDIDWNYNFKKDPGIMNFKNYLIKNKIQPSNAEELIAFYYKERTDMTNEIKELKDKYQKLKDSIVVRKNVLYMPYNDVVKEREPNKVTVNPFVNDSEKDELIQKIKKDIQNQPYVTDETGEKYQKFEEWLKMDSNHRPVQPKTLNGVKKELLRESITSNLTSLVNLLVEISKNK